MKLQIQETPFTGAKVKCIKAMPNSSKEFAKRIGYELPKVGKTYTVRGLVFSRGSDIYMVLLEEIKNPDLYQGYEFGFFMSDFKVLTKKKGERPVLGRSEAKLPGQTLNNN